MVWKGFKKQHRVVKDFVNQFSNLVFTFVHHGERRQASAGPVAWQQARMSDQRLRGDCWQLDVDRVCQNFVVYSSTKHVSASTIVVRSARRRNLHPHHTLGQWEGLMWVCLDVSRNFRQFSLLFSLPHPDKLMKTNDFTAVSEVDVEERISRPDSQTVQIMVVVIGSQGVSGSLGFSP